MGYDGRGNLTSVGTDTYSFTAENQLDTAVTHGPGGAVSSTNAYDPLGRMHWYRQNLVFTYDGGNILAELGAGNAIQRRYVYGPGMDEPVVWYEGAGTSQKYWLHADERGSVNAVTDGSGNVVGTNTYDEYGVPGAGNMGRFQYTGQAWLPEIGLYYYKARMYSPTLGRFMQADPTGYHDSLNAYSYASADPVNFADPQGTTAQESNGWIKPYNFSMYDSGRARVLPDGTILVTASLKWAISFLQVASVAGPVGPPSIGVKGMGSNSGSDESDQNNDACKLLDAAVQKASSNVGSYIKDTWRWDNDSALKNDINQADLNLAQLNPFGYIDSAMSWIGVGASGVAGFKKGPVAGSIGLAITGFFKWTGSESARISPQKQGIELRRIQLKFQNDGICKRSGS